MGFAAECEAVTAIGWSEDQGRRDEMEDGFIYVDNFGNRPGSCYVGVYDGHGGCHAVDFLLKNLHVCLLKNINSAVNGMDNVLRKTFQEVDDDMRIKGGVVSSGATACVSVIHQEVDGRRILHCAHLGDARAVLCRGGIAVRLTCESDHKATDPRELQRVLDSGGQVINERVNGILAIARAFGDYILKKPNQLDNVVSNDPDVSYVELNEATDAFLITACDGLWDVVDDQQAVNIVLEAILALKTHSPDMLKQKYLPEILSRSLVEEALHRGTADNVTVAVALL